MLHRYHGPVCVAFNRDLPITPLVVIPDSSLYGADRRNQGPIAVGDNPSLVISDAKCNLFGRTVRETLAPQMRLPGRGHREVHPAAVWRPRCCGAGSLRRAD